MWLAQRDSNHCLPDQRLTLTICVHWLFIPEFPSVFGIVTYKSKFIWYGGPFMDVLFFFLRGGSANYNLYSNLVQHSIFCSSQPDVFGEKKPMNVAHRAQMLPLWTPNKWHSKVQCPYRWGLLSSLWPLCFSPLLPLILHRILKNSL